MRAQVQTVLKQDEPKRHLLTVSKIRLQDHLTSGVTSSNGLSSQSSPRQLVMPEEFALATEQRTYNMRCAHRTQQKARYWCAAGKTMNEILIHLAATNFLFWVKNQKRVEKKRRSVIFRQNWLTWLTWKHIQSYMFSKNVPFNDLKRYMGNINKIWIKSGFLLPTVKKHACIYV